MVSFAKRLRDQGRSKVWNHSGKPVRSLSPSFLALFDRLSERENFFCLHLPLAAFIWL
jgi:hypothetical protein